MVQRGTCGGAWIHTGLWGKGGRERGHVQQNLDQYITASVTICQVRNKACELNGLRAGNRTKGEESRMSQNGMHPPTWNDHRLTYLSTTLGAECWRMNCSFTLASSFISFSASCPCPCCFST